LIFIGLVLGVPDFVELLSFFKTSLSDLSQAGLRQNELCRSYGLALSTLQRPPGRLLERRDNPRASFEGHVRETPWDDIHVAYFASEALWTYFTTPFLYNYPGSSPRNSLLGFDRCLKVVANCW
jgi:hypothetical protein